jgi:hypothetical protein
MIYDGSDLSLCMSLENVPSARLAWLEENIQMLCMDMSRRLMHRRGQLSRTFYPASAAFLIIDAYSMMAMPHILAQCHPKPEGLSTCSRSRMPPFAPS